MASTETGAPILTSFQYELRAKHHVTSPSSSENLSMTFVGGSLGGIANVLIGHPFDTLKVRMQMLNTSLFSCIKSMIAQEGATSLYKGIKSPLYNVPIIYSLCFGSYEVGLWALGVRFSKEPTPWQASIAGGWAGFVISFVLTPMELVKCRQQMEGVGQKIHASKACTIAKQIVQSQGIRQLFKANTLTIAREVPANAVYFGAFIYLKEAFKPIFGDNSFNTIVVGGLAGLASWIVGYPQDTIKTRIQCDVTNMYQRHRMFNDNGIIDCFRKTLRNEGIAGFWKGFSACAIRATFAEAITFTVYEKFRKRFVY